MQTKFSLKTPPPKHDHQPLIFPKGFLWGAATSAHQVEGNNTLNDWWVFEQTNLHPEDRSGLADNQYELFKEDFELAKDLNHNAHRLSIEWSRIEPQKGVFNEQEVDHYIEVLKTLKQKHFKVMLTLHHFTNPIWLSNIGGWENFKAPFYFNRFVE